LQEFVYTLVTTQRISHLKILLFDSPQDCPREVSLPTLMNHSSSSYFDQQSQAWILHSYADVVSALQNDSLMLPESGEADGSSPHDMRRSLAQQFSGSRIAEWRQAAESAGEALMRRLPDRFAIDIIGRFARPWALHLAGLRHGG
jgi:cytochrome P450